MLGAHHRDVDVLDNTNRLITSGIVFGAEPYAKIKEVSYPDRTVVYEITLHFKICWQPEALHGVGWI